MNSTERGFGNDLRRFALSVDIVEDQTFESIRDLVLSYVRKELSIEYFEVEEELFFGDEPGLRTLWCSDESRKGTGNPIRKDGRYLTQTGLAYGEGIPLWIVAGNRGVLDEASEYLDLWSDRSDLPPYNKPVPSLCAKTSIIVPLRHRRTVGVMYLESPEYQEITQVARDELQNLAEAIAVLWSDRAANKVARNTTRQAVGELREILELGDFPNLAKPQVFVASSDEADKEVVELILGVVQEKFGNKVRLVDWRSTSESGSVTAQLVKGITASKFGICYMSEPADGAKETSHRFVDNPNVLFEAGMLHALTHADRTAGWIPVREVDSPVPPFDFAHERLLRVPRREADGKVDKAELDKILTTRIQALLQEG